jgi:ribosomal protein S18 acetylase RimI-like enzyme
VIDVEIRELAAEDAPACDAIVAGFDYHFGLEEGRRSCAEAVRTRPGLVAVRGGEVFGFLTWEPRFDEAVEITWMAVHRDARGRGIGKRLVEALATERRAAGSRLLLVLTVSPNDEEPDPRDGGYEATRGFYRSAGFVLARDLPGEWSGDLAALLVRPI